MTDKTAGFSIAVPDSWSNVTHDPDFASTKYLRVAVGDPGLPQVLLVLLIKPSKSLPTIADLKPSLAAVSNDFAFSKTRIANAKAIQAVGTEKKKLSDGTTLTIHETVYVVQGSHGTLDFNFAGRVAGNQDPNVQTMINSLVLLK